MSERKGFQPWIICHTTRVDSVGMPVYWDGEQWGDEDDAAWYLDADLDTVELPTGGMWVQ